MAYTPDDFAAFSAVEKQYGQRLTLLIKRMDQVIKVITRTFGVKYGSWYFRGAEEGQMGTPTITDEDVGDIEFYDLSRHEMATLEYEYTFGFPKKFLFLADAEIEDILSKEISEYKEYMNKEKNTKKAKKEETEKLKKQALAKLTKEERKALKS